MADGFLGRWSRRKQDVAAGKAVVEPSAPAQSLAGGAGSVPVQPGQSGPSAAIASTSTSGAASTPTPLATQGPGVADAGGTPTPPPPTLADAQALTPASDFQPFVSRTVSPEVRNLAMKKLFADPHFNVMDGLDIYIGDYSQPDPLSPATLRQMASAHALGFFDHEKEAGEGASAPAGLPGEALAPDGAATPMAPIAPVAGQPRDDAEAGASQDVAQSQVCNAIPRGAACDSASELPGEYSGEPFSKPGPATPSAREAVALPASHTDHDHDAHLRLQPDDAPQREGAGRGTA